MAKIILDSNQYIQDLHKSISAIPEIELLKNKSIFITGCNGLICSAITDLLIEINNEFDYGISIFLGTRKPENTAERFNIKKNNFIKIISYDATKELNFTEHADYYIHGASNASPDLFDSNPIETMEGNLFGIKEILEKAKEDKSRVLYISTSEVYGNLATDTPIKENQYGSVDILSAHSSYASSKRAAETLCAAYKEQCNVDFVIARPGHIYGPSASKNDIRVASKFMYNVLEGKNIVLKSKGEQLRSYCYTVDSASAILTVLTNGISGNAYNISNPDSIITIAQMASYYAEFGKVKLIYDIPTETEKKSFNPMKISALCSDKLLELGWKNSFSKEEGFFNTLKILKEINCE